MAQNPSETAATRGGDQSDFPLFSTKNELSKILRCSAKHLENLTTRGLLRPIRLGRAIRFKRETVLECLKAMEGRLP